MTKPIKPNSSLNSSLSQSFLEKRASKLGGAVAASVSAFRKSELEEDIAQGRFVEGSGHTTFTKGLTPASHGTTLVKNAQITGGASGGFRGPSGNAIKQTPEIYSPLWLNSNLNLPRDKATINAWCRSFYALNPFVHNAINLHSTYPISKLSIKCPNKDVENFFNEMIEEIDLMNVCTQVAQEYHLLGEAFIYAELDQAKGKWSRLILQNPDYMIVNRTVMANEPSIMLRPDENLRRIVFSNKASDVEQKKQLNTYIVDAVKRGANIPLDNFHVSYLARKISPYEIRGTGLPVSVFRDLMLYDKFKECKFVQADQMVNPMTLVKVGSADFKPTPADLEAVREMFECHDEETEVLTDHGFKKFNEVITFDNSHNHIIGEIKSSPKPGIKIACFNDKNQQLEYHEPSRSFVGQYSGEMYHFKNDKIDLKVTPGHELFISDLKYEYSGNKSLRKTYWGDWHKVKARDLNLKDTSKFRSKINWSGNKDIKTVNVIGKEVPIELYLEFLGYLLSEGWLYNKGRHYNVGICQTYKKYQPEMSECINKFAAIIGKNVSNSVQKRKAKNPKWNDVWVGNLFGKDIYEFFKKEVSDENGNSKSFHKIIPRWVMDLDPSLLNILLEALVKGDGSHYTNPKGGNRFAYHSTSQQLADDVYEIVYKCGHVPIKIIQKDDRKSKKLNQVRKPINTVLWSHSDNGSFPNIYKTSRNSQTKVKNVLLNKVEYNGKVWCFTVPTGLFITRRGGKITIQSNSAEYDKDFKLFTHDALTVERVGYNSVILDTGADTTQLIKNISVGLQIPSVLMDGGADTTYANGGVALDVLKQRYMQFRNMLANWLKRKIFAPISKIQNFYEYKDGKKTLIIPEIDWNHMSLFDAGDYINILKELTSSSGEGQLPRVSMHTMYRSLGLDYEDEMRKLRREQIQHVVAKKELEALETLSLNNLRSLNDEDEIIESSDDAAGGEGGKQSEPMPGELPGAAPSTPSAP